jgi:hypothetical protein
MPILNEFLETLTDPIECKLVEEFIRLRSKPTYGEGEYGNRLRAFLDSQLTGKANEASSTTDS